MGVVGDDIAGFDSGAAEILVEHRARTGRGFNLGRAAEWIASSRASIPSRTRSTT